MSSRTQQHHHHSRRHTSTKDDDIPPPPPPEEPEYVIETASLSYCEASELLRHAMDEARRALVVAPTTGGLSPTNKYGGGPSITTSSTASAMVSPRSGVEAMHEAFAGRVEGLERQLNDALGQRAGLERALHHAAADSLRAQNDVKLAKRETEQLRQQLILTEAELHKKVEELARRPVSTESGLPADEELKMRHNVAVLRAEIALLSDLVNRSPDQQMQALQRKVSEMTAEALKAADAAKSRENLLSEVHQRLQAAMERMAHAEDKRDAALSRCATLEDDNAALQRTLEDTTRALRQQAQTAQAFAAALSKQIVAHEHSARAAVGRDHAVAERELALFGAGLKTRALLEQSERQAALRMHLLRELSTDATSCYAKDRVAARYLAKWQSHCIKTRSSSLRVTEGKLRESEQARTLAEQRAATAEDRAFEQVRKLKESTDEAIKSVQASADSRIEEAMVLSSCTREALAIEREAIQCMMQTMQEESASRYSLSLLCTIRERSMLVLLSNQGMLNLRDTLMREMSDRERSLAEQLHHAQADLATVRAAASHAVSDAESHQTVVERALQEAKRQRDKQEAEFKQQLAQQERDFVAREQRLKMEIEKKAATSKEEADRIDKKYREAQQALSEKERKQLADAEKQRETLQGKEDERKMAFRELQNAMAAAARDDGHSPPAGQQLMSTDESVARERMRRKWLVENIKHVVDGLEQCYLHDVASCVGDGLEPTAITNLRHALIRRAGHTNRVLEIWQRRERMLRALLLWTTFAMANSRRKLRGHATRSIHDLSQKLTRVKDIAQEAIKEKKAVVGVLQQVEGEADRTKAELESLRADYDALRRSHAMRKAETQQKASDAAKNGGSAADQQVVDAETRAVLSSARGQIEQLTDLLKRSRENEEAHARTIERMSEKLNLETAAAAELKATIVTLLSQAQEAGADLSAAKAASQSTADSLFVLETRPLLIRDLMTLVKTLETDGGSGSGGASSAAANNSVQSARAAAQKLVQNYITSNERRQFL